MVDWHNNVSSNLLIKKKLDKYVSYKTDENINIDFNELRNINSDTVGYIKVFDTNVDYVVVRGEDNEYYLKHNFNKEYNIAGWIFTDYRNKVDGTDNNLVIYGHDTNDGSMFGSLSNLLDEKNIKDKNNLIINFITDKSNKLYKIFSVYTIEPEEYYIKTNFEDDDFEQFKVKMKDRSIYNIDVNLKNKNIITLSTCQNYGLMRLAVHAVEI